MIQRTRDIIAKIDIYTIAGRTCSESKKRC